MSAFTFTHGLQTTLYNLRVKTIATVPFSSYPCACRYSACLERAIPQVATCTILAEQLVYNTYCEA